MKKLVINENWEQEIVEDSTRLVALAYQQGANNSYVLKYTSDDEDLSSQYKDFTECLTEMNADKTAIVYLVMLPNTSHICTLLDMASYNGVSATSQNKEATDAILMHPDCEVLEYWQGESSLIETKKRKKKPFNSMYFTTGDVAYNIAQFNKHMGTDFNNPSTEEAKAADSTTKAEGSENSSSADTNTGSADTSSLGENLLEASTMTAYDKVKALNNGTRGFNAKAASNDKLQLYHNISIKNNFNVARQIIEQEMKARGLLNNIKQKIDISSFIADFSILQKDIQLAEIQFVVDHIGEAAEIISSILDTNFSPAMQFKYFILDIIYLLYLNELEDMKKLRDSLLQNFEVKSVVIKEILNDLLSDSNITAKIRELLTEVKSN